MASHRQRSESGLKLNQWAAVAALSALTLTLVVLDRPPASAEETSGVRDAVGVPSQAGQRPELAAALVLDGRSLTIPDVISVARGNTQVTLDPAAMERVRQSFGSAKGNTPSRSRTRRH